jgi:hypothetical protein
MVDWIRATNLLIEHCYQHKTASSSRAAGNKWHHP